MSQQVHAMADPVSKKLQHLMGNIDRMVNSITVLFDTTRGTNDIRSSINEAKLAIKRFGNLSLEMNDLVREEKIKLSDILQNVANITKNLDKSNKEISAILGNAHTFSNDLVKSNFKDVISGAHKTITTINKALEETEQNKGNLSKLLKDETLYNELVNSNKKIQIILDDLHEHPEKYIKLSVFSRRPKGLQITKKEEEKLKKILDSIP
jgi:phospholipid/cholesterol/gamma-HCH transport system substrate-binding protein